MRADHRYSDRSLAGHILIDFGRALVWVGFFILLCLSIGMPAIIALLFVYGG